MNESAVPAPLRQTLVRLMNSDATIVALTAIACAIIIMKFMPIYADALLNGDTAWYLHIAKLLLEGKPFRQIYFDTNPPFAPLLFMPPVVFHQLTGLSLPDTIFGFCFLLIFLNSAINIRCLYRITEGLIVPVYFTIATLYIALLHNFAYIGHKDYIAALAIPTIVLTQLSFLFETKEPASKSAKIWKLWLRVAFIINMVLLLLKPHYYLIPLTMLAARLVYTRDIKTLRDWDTLAVFAFPLLYLLCNQILFPGYYTDNLFFAQYIYVPQYIYILAGAGIYIFRALALLFFTHHMAKAPYDKKIFLIMIFVNVAFFCAAVYLIQAHGFYTHSIPFFGTLFLTFAMVTVIILSDEKIPVALLLILMTIALSLSNQEQKMNAQYKRFYTDEINRLVHFTAALDGDSYFFETPVTDIAYATALYSDKQHISRFPSRWILDFLEKKKRLEPTSEATNNFVIDKYAQMLLEDFERHPPDHLMLYKDKTEWMAPLFRGHKTIPIRDYFANNADFTRFLSHYHKIDEISVIYSDESTIAYDVFSRNKPE